VIVPGCVCVDFADVRTLFQGRGSGAVGMGTAVGPDRAERAVSNALACPFLGSANLARANGVLVRIAAGEPSRSEIESASRAVWRAIGGDTPVIVGDAAEPDLGTRMRVTLVTVGRRPRRCARPCGFPQAGLRRVIVKNEAPRMNQRDQNAFFKPAG
jgi:cell division protein FtsZ